LKKPKAARKSETSRNLAKTAIVNVVATASVNQEMDFDKLRKYKEIFQDSDVYGGRVAYFKTKKMEGKVSIFSSGKMISIGTKSELDAFHELKAAMEFLVKKGFARPVALEPKTQNIVVSSDFQMSVNLEKLAEKSKTIYEPEQFPGAILRFNEPCKTSILVFASGKVVITGLKSSDQIEPTIRKLGRLLEKSQ
jgi:transcription initiation factor TFIID TATA-box-binding protein